MAKEKSVPDVGKGISRMVSIDMEVLEIIEYNKDEGILLTWDPYSFKKLPEDVVQQLRPDNVERYFKAKFQADDRAEKAKREMESTLEVFSPLVPNSAYRLNIRKRPGYHQVWKSPGADFDAAMQGPYTQVRKQKEGEDKAPGEENGEVLKLLDGEGKVELIALECKEELFQKHVEAMARNSGRMIRGAKEDFFRAAEQLNRGINDKGSRITPVDESGELQA